jgi:hypothetical protein
VLLLSLQPQQGTNLSTVVFPDLEVVRLYRPRTDVWLDHFEFSGASILPKTLIGQATVKVLDFNSPERTEERAILLAKGRYPHATASQYLASQLV